MDLAARAVEGRGKRAALATYYAPLHFLATQHALARIGPARFGPVRRVFDSAAEPARRAPPRRACSIAASVVAIDRSGFALSEARHTYAAFGLLAQTKRAQLPERLPRPAPGDLWVLGWAVNELDERSRNALGERLVRAIESGVRVLLLEPLASGVVPWWPEWGTELARLGVVDLESKARVEAAGVDRARRSRGRDSITA